MTYPIYTDDGTVHEGVPSVEMPANAEKTIYNKFIAENDVPATPEGELEVTQNGTYDVTDKASVHVQVEGGEVETEEQTVTPTESAQVVVPSAGKLLSKVTVLPVQTEQQDVTPTEAEQEVTPSEGKFLSQVTVNPIPSQYIVPAGKKEITANGDNIDVTQYASVKVAVQAAGAPTMSATYMGSSVVVGTDVSTLSEFVNIYITFSDGTEISLDDDDVGPFDISGSISVEGDNVLTVSFGGMTAQFTVEGVAPSPVLDRLTATYTGGTVPAGTTLSQLTGITVKAVYDDDSEVTLTASQYQLSGTLTAGQTNTVTVAGLGDYAGNTTTFSVTVAQEEPVATSAAFNLYHYNYVGTLPANGVKCTSTSGSSVMASVSFDNPLPTKPVRFVTEVGNPSVSPTGSGNRLINATFVRNGDVWNGTGTNVGTGATISVTIPDSDIVFAVDSRGKYTGLTSMDCPKSGAISYMWGKWFGSENKDTQFEVYTFYTG